MRRSAAALPYKPSTADTTAMIPRQPDLTTKFLWVLAGIVTAGIVGWAIWYFG